ncbi:hypothetical protein MMB232_00872 [Brevundimonas subvibrioides]|uniref:hypothetical protein n=1 Tax=Brevundimonas subvibrioides TaxID=74313 RepID=UPI0032D595E8
MSRVSAILLAALIAAAPLSAAAQDRGGFRGDRDRNGDRGEMRERRQMSVAEAQSIAQGRAGGARFVGYMGQRGNSHVFRFERDGRVMDISVDAGG